MWRSMAVALLVVGGWGCGGMSQQEAQRQVDQLMVLYQENRPKFVLQKQELEQGDCGRAGALSRAAADKVREAAMSPAENETLTLVKMELDQAAKNCNAR